jgi:hypothetical protein
LRLILRIAIPQLARITAEKDLIVKRHDKEMEDIRQRLRTAEANLDGAVAADEVRTLKTNYSRQIQELTVQISMMEEEVKHDTYPSHTRTLSPLAHNRHVVPPTSTHTPRPDGSPG